ncbi:MAG TPA: TIGR03560 family F420-dependent LLM class oxidoreductase [Methylomirabilota bacterium]|nr:TIGR03560 family F420-dependent LLM class oxidoreductase [Methylomirabilota bacterium]
MRVGIIVPQGWTGEYQGVDPAEAWRRTVAVAQRAESLGFESAWLFDHFHTTPDPLDTITFEAYTSLTSLADKTERILLGHIVTCAAYRNPALVAKMISTMDVISGGRMQVGLGAGWKREEFDAYGYEFPSTRERLARLRETLEIVTRMFEPGRATFAGEHTSIAGAINEPKPLQQPRPTVMVGGNGREVTWRLAARFADELNLDATPPDELPEALEVVAERCREVDRDPATLPVSVHIWWEQLDKAPSRSELLAKYREAGASRIMTLVRASADDPDELDRFREDCVTAGVELERELAPA